MTGTVPIELYRKREKIYPRAVSGIYARFRVTGVLLLLGAFHTVPWLRWPLFTADNRQAVLFDLPNRKFYLFDIILWPQDFLFLAGFLILCALSLFFFTALAGRLWCGYACPQTVWTEVFLWIERLIEGNRHQQIKRDKAPISTRKLAKKVFKHSLWIIFSLFTGFTFVGYFTPLETLLGKTLSATLGPWELFWIIFYGLATYGNAGWMREQVCLYMCPYARFQSAMFDRNTLIIAYDKKRGEPRGARSRINTPPKALGDCINCTLCVQVCPTGIDIRDGLQYACIGCAACIDVCDEVMQKMDYPKGLISYTTENATDGKLQQILRPRVIIYAALLTLLCTALVWGLLKRIPLELDIMRDRNTLYRETEQGLIENIYTLRILNMDTQAHQYRLRTLGADYLHLKDPGLLQAKAGEVLSVVVSLQANPDALQHTSTRLWFEVQALGQTDIARREIARFLGPPLSGLSP